MVSLLVLKLIADGGALRLTRTGRDDFSCSCEVQIRLRRRTK